MSEVVVLSNDVVPGMGMPVAAPGLRAWGIAEGLRAHGHDVTLVVDQRVAARAWTRSLPPPRPAHTLIASPAKVGQMIRAQRPDALVLTNSNHFDSVGDLGGTSLVFDFFAPKVLELEQDEELGTPEALQTLKDRKLRALGRSDVVIVNGRKKLDYVRDWLRRAGNPDAPTDVVNMPIPAMTHEPPAEGPLRAVVSGYVQPWSRPGEWAEVIRPMLEAGKVELHLIVGQHWGGGVRRTVPGTISELVAMPGVVSHGTLEFDEFRTLMAECHFSIDLFERNPERELAFVTRTAVSLSTGLPAIHVPFTEVSELINDHGAGWLVAADDHAGIETAITEAIERPDVLAAKRKGALELAALLEPAAAVEPLHRMLEDVRR